MSKVHSSGCIRPGIVYLLSGIPVLSGIVAGIFGCFHIGFWGNSSHLYVKKMPNLSHFFFLEKNVGKIRNGKYVAGGSMDLTTVIPANLALVGGTQRRWVSVSAHPVTPGSGPNSPSGRDVLITSLLMSGVHGVGACGKVWLCSFSGRHSPVISTGPVPFVKQPENQHSVVS